MNVLLHSNFFLQTNFQVNIQIIKYWKIKKKKLF